jgi:dCMP deaminase
MSEEKKEKYVRPSWDEYFMDIAKAVATRGTCDRGRSGCVFAKDKQILVTGYVGSALGLPHCDDVGHLMHKEINDDETISDHCVRTIHAEQNAIVQAAKRGVPLDGATVYCKMTPCRVCALMLINCGVVRIVCEKKYHAGVLSEKLFKEAGIELEYFDESLEQYKGMTKPFLAKNK